MLTGIIEPGGKREVMIGKYILTLENDQPVEWEIDDTGRMSLKPASRDGGLMLWIWNPKTAAHDPEHLETCYCEDCVCRNYPDIARRHPNCKSASADVAYLRDIKGVLGRMIADHRWPDKEE